MNVENKNEESQSSYYINNQGTASLEIKLGDESAYLKNRILVSPESRTFIDDIKIELISLMGNGKISYKNPSSKYFLKIIKNPLMSKNLALWL